MLSLSPCSLLQRIVRSSCGRSALHDSGFLTGAKRRRQRPEITNRKTARRPQRWNHTLKAAQLAAHRANLKKNRGERNHRNRSDMNDPADPYSRSVQVTETIHRSRKPDARPPRKCLPLQRPSHRGLPCNTRSRATYRIPQMLVGYASKMHTA